VHLEREEPLPIFILEASVVRAIGSLPPLAPPYNNNQNV
jgi:hypothetical protein